MNVHTLLNRCNDYEKLFQAYINVNDEALSIQQKSDLKVKLKELYDNLLTIPQNNITKAIIYIIPHYETCGNFKTNETYEKTTYDVCVYDGHNEFIPILFTENSNLVNYKISGKTYNETDEYKICACILCDMFCISSSAESYVKLSADFIPETELRSYFAKKDFEKNQKIKNEYLELAKKEYSDLNN